MKIVIAVLVVAALVFAGLWWYESKLAKETGGSGSALAAPPSGDGAAKAAGLLKQARSAARDGEPAKARALYEKTAADFPDTWSGREAELELGAICLKEGMKREAVEAFRKGLPNADETRKGAILATIRRIEEELAGKAAAPDKAEKPPEDPSDTTYTVQHGDTLTGIARKCNTTVEQLKLVNNRTDDRLNVGDVIRVTRQMPALKVSKKDLKLRLFFKGAMVREYPVCIGKEAELTPAGEYTVADKLKNPPWTPAGKKTIPYGDPENILGTRWMTLISADGVKRGYGIHGTTQPESVPGRASAGCIRMLNPDVEQIYEWAPTGTKVTIAEE